MAVDPASYSHVTSFVYSQADPNPQQALEKLATGDTIFISSVLAEKYGLQLGDQLAIKTRTGYRDFLIAAIVVDYYNQGMVIDGSWVDMSRYFRQKDANAYLINVEDGYSISAVQDRIDKLYGKRDRLTIISNQSLFESISVLMEQAFSMFDVLALIAMMVGFFGIANTLTMNVIERTQEIGMLRGVGMTRSQVVLMILAEAALMGLIGGILGIVFGIVLSRIFMMAMTTMSGYTLTYILPMERIIAAMVIAVIISLLAAFLPAFRAARIRILEAIQYE
jgi:putative ABC transport system permease protein